VIEVPASSTSFAPTTAQIVNLEQLLALKSKHQAPSLGTHTTSSQVATSGGPPTDVTAPGPQAPATFTVFENSLINSVCSGCAQSTVNEPEAANNGRYIVETSNWNIAYSTNGGKTPVWSNLNPYSFSSGFCCDQEIVYSADRDVFLLLQLDFAGEGAATNGLALSVARGSTPTSWCTYKFAGAIGGGATDTPDFPKIAISNNNVFITWNDYPPNAGFARAGLARMPLDALAACAGFSYSFLARTTEFTFALARTQVAHDKFYWVSNWMLDGTVNGRNLRIFSWPDNSGTYSFVTRAVNAYTFGTAACNWCGRLDPRYESVVITPAEFRAQANAAFAGDQILEVATDAGPSSFINGQNYIVYNYFKLNSLAYIGNDQTYNTSFSFGYPGCNVNAKGYVGCAMVQGVNPGGLIVLQDNVNPTQPWGFSFVLAGINANANWGDYVETNPWIPGGGPFQTVLWRLNGTTVQPFHIVWGRGSDTNDYLRWNGK